MSDPELDAAIALLADGLRGALEWEARTGGVSLPRPVIPKVSAAPAPASVPAPTPAPVVEEEAPKIALDDVSALKASAADRLRVLEQDVIGPDCDRCKLHRGRSQVVFGVGNPEADLVFVGEGPGAEEDRRGEPFVGRAGRLLDKMIVAMGLSRDAVYICNVVKCRPPNNRDPEVDEVDACEPFLKAQLAVLQPKVIVTLGRYAAHALLKTTRPISRLRGHWGTYEGVDLMPTYHPAYLLRNEAMKRPAWEDLKQVVQRLQEHQSE